MGRGGSGGDFLAGWIAPALEGTRAGQAQAGRPATCPTSAGRNIPTTGAEQVFLRILRMPLTGADHRERIMLGLAVASRHAAIAPALKRLGLGKLVDKEEKRQAVCIGLAMRLAYTISAGGRQRSQAVPPAAETEEARADGA